MKNPKTPARLPSKVPSNQTGGTAWGKKLAAEISRIVQASEAREDDEEFKNPVDELFEELEQKKPEHFAVRQYKKYKLAAGDICSK